MLPAGRYYVGDLCYVIADEKWDGVCDYICSEHSGEGKTPDGHPFVFSGTAYGDGVYADQFGNRYGVDAGIIGAIAVEHLDVSEAEAESLGAIIDFVGPVDVTYEDGTITIGHVRINTGDDSSDDYVEDEPEDEDD